MEASEAESYFRKEIKKTEDAHRDMIQLQGEHQAVNIRVGGLEC